MVLQVARVFRNPLVSCVDAARLTRVCQRLAKVWDDKARQLSREMRAAAGALKCIMYSVKGVIMYLQNLSRFLLQFPLFTNQLYKLTYMF
jgi:hypothetical protein